MRHVTIDLRGLTFATHRNHLSCFYLSETIGAVNWSEKIDPVVVVEHVSDAQCHHRRCVWTLSDYIWSRQVHLSRKTLNSIFSFNIDHTALDPSSYHTFSNRRPIYHLKWFSCELCRRLECHRNDKTLTIGDWSTFANQMNFIDFSCVILWNIRNLVDLIQF